MRLWKKNVDNAPFCWVTFSLFLDFIESLLGSGEIFILNNLFYYKQVCCSFLSLAKTFSRQQSIENKTKF
jgi:hypothetical protein